MESNLSPQSAQPIFQTQTLTPEINSTQEVIQPKSPWYRKQLFSGRKIIEGIIVFMLSGIFLFPFLNYFRFQLGLTFHIADHIFGLLSAMMIMNISKSLAVSSNTGIDIVGVILFLLVFTIIFLFSTKILKLKPLSSLFLTVAPHILMLFLFLAGIFY